MGEWDVLVCGASHNEVVKLRARAYGFNTRTTKVLRLGLVCVSIRKQVVLLLVCSFCCSILPITCTMVSVIRYLFRDLA